MEFKKASFWQVIKYKIKWVINNIDYLFDRLEELMWFYEKIHIFQV